MAAINSKTASRIAAIQALYQFESNNRTASADELVKSMQASYDSPDFKDLFEIPNKVSMKLHASYFEVLVTNAISNLETLDTIIAEHLKEPWNPANLHMSLAALLRVAIAELLYCPDTPPKVIINEYTNIGSSIAKVNEVPFINSLLDKISVKYRS